VQISLHYPGRLFSKQSRPYSTLSQINSEPIIRFLLTRGSDNPDIIMKNTKSYSHLSTHFVSQMTSHLPEACSNLYCYIQRASKTCEPSRHVAKLLLYRESAEMFCHINTHFITCFIQFCSELSSLSDLLFNTDELPDYGEFNKRANSCQS
jgi:hypothetical protein